MSLDLTLPLPRRRGRRRAARRILTRLPGRSKRLRGRRPLGLAGLATGGALLAIAVRRITGRRHEGDRREPPGPTLGPETPAIVDSTSTGGTPEGARTK